MGLFNVAQFLLKIFINVIIKDNRFHLILLVTSALENVRLEIANIYPTLSHKFKLGGIL